MKLTSVTGQHVLYKWVDLLQASSVQSSSDAVNSVFETPVLNSSLDQFMCCEQAFGFQPRDALLARVLARDNERLNFLID